MYRGSFFLYCRIKTDKHRINNFLVDYLQRSILCIDIANFKIQSLQQAIN